MTLNGAIKQLHELRSAEDMPIYYKPAIAEVINVLLMDTQEVRHGKWILGGEIGWPKWTCSACGGDGRGDYKLCPWCGANMDEVEEWANT